MEVMKDLHTSFHVEHRGLNDGLLLPLCADRCAFALSTSSPKTKIHLASQPAQSPRFSCPIDLPIAGTIGVVERFGKFNRLARAGFTCLLWPMESVAGTVSLRVQQVRLPSLQYPSSPKLIRLPVLPSSLTCAPRPRPRTM